MPQPFHSLNVAEFGALLNEFSFSRDINSVHMHHTWRPNRAQDRGHDSVFSMWRYHTEDLGWSDIAQHVTIDGNGTIWTGRNWNAPPASARGNNGSHDVGPFMFEIIGDFDHGKDPFDGAQKQTVIDVIALVQKRFGLPPEALRFHNEMSPKSCPGTSIEKAEVIAAVSARHASDSGLITDPQDLNVCDAFNNKSLRYCEVLQSLSDEGLSRSGKPSGEELPERQMPREHIYRLFGDESGEARGGSASRPRLSPEMLAEIRPHIINLSEGQLSSDGDVQTTQRDVDAIFTKHLPAALKQAKKDNARLDVVFYAHGGLVSENNALESAYSHINWWKQRPHVYPIYFIWETGLFEVIGDALRGKSRSGASHDLAARGIADGLIEKLVRKTNVGPWAWSRMKLSAAAASAPGGGARSVAEGLAKFAKNTKKATTTDDIALHAVGHSAGSVFHAHFLPAALNAGARDFKTLHFLAPAIRIDEFEQHLAGLIGPGNGIDHLSLFTMYKELERDDHVAWVYRKSLLYLIYHALEKKKEEPILGLEESLASNENMAELFGLGGYQSEIADVIFSETSADSGRSASKATAHGDFDNDSPTMQSVLRRVVEAADNESVDPLPEEIARDGNMWGQNDWASPQQSEQPQQYPQQHQQPSCPSQPAQPWNPAPTPIMLSPAVPASISSQRTALCIGINRYQRSPLRGCVADAKQWSSLLTNQGFHVRQLLDEQATRANILYELKRLVSDTKAGDVLAFQYAGHGTQFNDRNGDDSDGLDEAYCPVDIHTGATILDDEVQEIFQGLAPGVSLTCFIDCCHSGSITRMAPVGDNGDVRARNIEPTETMWGYYLSLKHNRNLNNASHQRGVAEEILFAACQDHQLAYERSGQGDFTRTSMEIFQQYGASLSNDDFFKAVSQRFSNNRNQTPNFHAPEALKSHPLLQPISARENSRQGAAEPPTATTDDVATALAQLQSAVTALQRVLLK